MTSEHTMKMLALISGAFVAIALSACSSTATELDGANGNSATDPGAPGGSNGGDAGPFNGAVDEATGLPVGTTCNDKAKSYIGIGGKELKDTRQPGQAGIDRARTKSYEVLLAEFPRVIGVSPPSMATLGPTLGQAANHWYVEARPSAVGLNSTLQAAFEGCLVYTAKDPQFSAAPTEASAKMSCMAMARKFWSRTVSESDVQGCVDVATVDSAKESTNRRWAYACASLLTSTPFLAY